MRRQSERLNCGRRLYRVMKVSHGARKRYQFQCDCFRIGQGFDIASEGMGRRMPPTTISGMSEVQRLGSTAWNRTDCLPGNGRAGPRSRRSSTVRDRSLPLTGALDPGALLQARCGGTAVRTARRWVMAATRSGLAVTDRPRTSMAWCWTIRRVVGTRWPTNGLLVKVVRVRAGRRRSRRPSRRRVRDDRRRRARQLPSSENILSNSSAGIAASIRSSTRLARASSPGTSKMS